MSYPIVSFRAEVLSNAYMALTIPEVLKWWTSKQGLRYGLGALHEHMVVPPDWLINVTVSRRAMLFSLHANLKSLVVHLSVHLQP